MKISQKPASNRADIPPFYVMEVMRAAEEREKEGGEVIHLEVGQPATGAPEGVICAVEDALRSQNPLGYTNALGTSGLRTAISDHYTSWYNERVNPENIAITTGASASCVLAFLACFDSGDRVAVASPGYPCYKNILQSFGVDVVDIQVDISTRFQLTPDMLEAHTPLAGVIIASPSNPTGTMLDTKALAEIGSWCQEHNVQLISDEIYHGITYGDRAETAISYAPNAIVINSFSKYFSMTGWRLGWLIAPDELHRAIERLAQNLYISAPTLSQIAGIAAFQCHDELQKNITRYTENRKILLERLPSATIEEIAPADGAFYIWGKVSHIGKSKDLSERWLKELGIAATSGIDFDPIRGNEYIRFSFAGATRDIIEATDRLISWAKNS